MIKIDFSFLEKELANILSLKLLYLSHLGKQFLIILFSSHPYFLAKDIILFEGGNNILLYLSLLE